MTILLGMFAFTALGNEVPDETPDDLTILDPNIGSGFGSGIAGLGDVNGDGLADFAVAAPRMAVPGTSDGEVQVFFGNRAGVASTPSQRLQPPSLEQKLALYVTGGDINGDGFGDAIVGTVVPRGTNAMDLCLWVFRGSTDGLRVPTTPSFRGPTASGAGGFAVIGDCNGDGLPDLAVGLPLNRQKTGEVVVFFGNPGGQWDQPNQRIVPTQPGEYFASGAFGRRPADYNRDGFDDLVVGSTHYRAWHQENGRAQLFLGSPTGLSTNASWVTLYPFKARRGVDDPGGQYFGHSAVPVGDINQDGFPDLVIPAPFAWQNDRSEGVVFGYYGTKQGLSSRHHWSVQMNRQHAVLGLLAEPAGDVNGDGYPDLLLGAPDYSDIAIREGLIAVFMGGPSGFRREPAFTLRGDVSHVRLGLFAAGVGDLNGDGYDDLVVSRSGNSLGQGDIRFEAIKIIYGTKTGPRGSTATPFSKPIAQWLTQEWRRLSMIGKASIGVIGCALLGFVGVAGRRVWKKRTIVLVEKRERESVAAERERIAQDLHDKLGSRISRIHLIAELVREDPLDPGTLRTFTDELTKEASDLRAAIEQVATHLQPGVDTAEGVVQALSQHASNFFTGSSVRCFQELPDDLPISELPPAVRDELFPCVREALSNVLRHSRASEVWFKIRSESSCIIVSVEDNGKGFLQSEVHQGRGLANFTARMNRIGGKATVRSSPDRGTCVTFVVNGSATPVRRAAAG